MRRAGILFCIVGPAGSGKTTFAQKLLAEFKELSKSISVTSRKPREGEVHGVNYHFVTREDFQKKIAAGEFFEWEETHGNLYGTLKKNLDDAIRSGSDLLLDIDIRGALNFKSTYPENTAIIFLIPPSAEELKKRMQNRGSIGAEELQKRLETAKAEYSLYLADRAGARQISYIVLNDSLDLSYQTIRGILIAERARGSRVAEDDLKGLLTI